MWPILVGIETEYGFSVEGHGAEDQVDDAVALVRGTPDGRFVGWDYRFESPRSDLRGFQVSSLSFDPEDAKHDRGKVRQADREIRSDRILANGARFYNDHGHPELSTPECWSLEELSLQDKAGEQVVMRAARVLEQQSDRAVTVYKNNTDGHGSSYGTHESYLVPRELGFDRLYKSVLPVLIARQVVCGSGKVGSESGMAADYQISQRADFFTESSSVDTLYRRPVFNTRDEPHAQDRDWIRLHVICGDANRIPRATARKAAFVKLALWLERLGLAPSWDIQRPAASMVAVSHDLTGQGRIELSGGNWTTPIQVLGSYVGAAERHLDSQFPGVCEALELCSEAIDLLEDWTQGGDKLSEQADWAAKHKMLQSFIDSENTDWSDPSLRSYDLAYHNVDSQESLYAALQDSGWLASDPEQAVLEDCLSRSRENTRALARSVAVEKFADQLTGVSWGTLSFKTADGSRTLELKPEKTYPDALLSVCSVEEFVSIVERL